VPEFATANHPRSSSEPKSISVCLVGILSAVVTGTLYALAVQQIDCQLRKGPAHFCPRHFRGVPQLVEQNALLNAKGVKLFRTIAVMADANQFPDLIEELGHNLLRGCPV
jgi:hypothetical protein